MESMKNKNFENNSPPSSPTSLTTSSSSSTYSLSETNLNNELKNSFDATDKMVTTSDPASGQLKTKQTVTSSSTASSAIAAHYNKENFCDKIKYTNNNNNTNKTNKIGLSNKDNNLVHSNNSNTGVGGCVGGSSGTTGNTGNTGNGNNNIVLLNNFVINKKRYRVFLHSNLVVWEKENSKKGKIKLPVCDIINVRTYKKPPSNQSSPLLSAVEDPKSFTIHYAQRKTNIKNKNVWRHQTITFSNNESRIVKLWLKALKDLLDEQRYRPKSLLLFVNPYGGKKESMKIFEKYGKPLFAVADIDVNVVVSQRADQIRDFIEKQHLDMYDGIICVGGDGTFSEVFNGILLRTMNNLGINTQNPDYIPKPQIPIGVIPGGSTDTVSYCLHGTTDIQTSVIHIVLGLTGGLDLASVRNESGLLKFYASILSYGYLGDVSLDSEKYRWMGPKRYEYVGFKKFMRNRGYESEVSFIVDNATSSPVEGPRCLENCKNCEDAVTEMNSPRLQPISEVDESRDEDEDGSQMKWKTIKGKYFMINGANISCACARSPNGFSPYCHLGDGNIDLILIKHTSLFNNIRLLLKLSSADATVADLPFVDIYRTKRFRLKANTESFGTSSVTNLSNSTQPLRTVGTDETLTSNWNCDGEVLTDLEVTVQGHCQLVDVFRRGLHDNADNENDGVCCF